MSASDKTEKPTPKRKKDERKKGNVAKSREVPNALTLVGAVVCIFILINSSISQLKMILSSTLSMNFNTELTNGTAHSLFMNGLIDFIKLFLPIGLVVMLVGIIANIMQTGLLFTAESLKPKFSKLNPFNGLKSMFSQKAAVTAIKSTLLLIVLGYIGYSFVEKNYFNILKLGNIHFPNLIYSIIDLGKKVFIMAIAIAVVIAIIDFAYEFYSHSKSLKMTKEEIKEEFKQAEGNPQIKSQIRQKQRQMASQRMIQNTKDATVIITNPTHISIAIKYERDKDKAPIVVAKGADLLAMKIREIAKENDIPMIENVPLARLMYRKVDIDQEVPADMYEAVAEVLVAVYKIKNRYKRNK